MIKKIFSLGIIISFTQFQSFCQQPVQVSGLLSKDKPVPVKLFKVVEGELSEIATSVPGNDKRFGFLFYPEYEGFYSIGTGTPLAPNNNYKFYFKGGDKLSLSISDTSYTLTGKANSSENVVMYQWHQFIYSLRDKSLTFQSTFKDFFPDLEAAAAKTENFLKNKKTGNSKFDKLMRENMDFDMAAYAVNFLNTPRSAHPSLEEYSPYYATLKTSGFSKNTSVVYTQPWGLRTLQQLVYLNKRQGNIKTAGALDDLEATLNIIPNDTIKGNFVLQTASRMKSITDYQDLVAGYGKYLLTKKQQEKGRELQATLATFKPGDPAYNFTYPDKNDKMVSMADLKGKVVLVDVWATWCGPCKKEIPHLKKLEEEMKGTDVQIVSISVDEQKDKEKWLKMIRDENLGGLQLFATGWSDITKYYKINGIPRFMIFDRNGKIVTVDSPRPSSPELKKLLEKTLATK